MRRRSAVTRALPALLAAALGCASVAALTGRPERLLEEGRAAIRSGDFGAGYAHLEELRTRFPWREETTRAYPLAAAAVRKLYRRHQYTDPDSAWVTREPDFMFDWLGSMLAAGDAQQPLDTLMLGMSHAFFARLVARAETSPELRGWAFHPVFDNGLIDSIRAERLPGAPTPAPVSRLPGGARGLRSSGT
jgi:hypothetical protein